MMLYKLIPPSVVTATIQLPASKSISNRALIINALGKGIYPPENLSDCDDTQVMIKALTEGKETIDIMAAGTAMRFLTAYLSVTPGELSLIHISKKDKEAKLRNAVYGNLKLMRKTLSAEQYAKYAALMNITLQNKGIELNK